MIAQVWPVATYGCESWILRKNEQTPLDVFEMEGLKRLCGFRGQRRKQNNDLVLNKAGVKGNC